MLLLYGDLMNEMLKRLSVRTKSLKRKQEGSSIFDEYFSLSEALLLRL
jgi:hypothetical protein